MSTQDIRLVCSATVLGFAVLALFALLAHLGLPIVPTLARTFVAPML